MEKKHLGYSDNLLIRVLKSQEKDLKNASDEFKKTDEYKGIVAFQKEILQEALDRGLVKLPEKKVEPKKEEPKKDVGQ